MTFQVVSEMQILIYTGNHKPQNTTAIKMNINYNASNDNETFADVKVAKDQIIRFTPILPPFLNCKQSTCIISRQTQTND